jgi:uncharacterized Zn ribbon protein
MTITINKHTAIRKTNSGKTIEVTVERGTWNEEISLDGMATGTIKTHIIDSTNIILRDQSGKALTTGDSIDMVTPLLYHNHAELISKGAVARIGDAYITREIVDLANDAIAECIAAAPKTAEQVAIDTANAQAEIERDAWYDSAEQVNARKLEREMERPDSDY